MIQWLETIVEYLEDKKSSLNYWLDDLVSEYFDLPSSWYRFYRWAFTDPYYFLRTYVFGPYNRIVISTLPRTWMDRDTVLLHACFQVLVDFVEKEARDDHHLNSSYDELVASYEGQDEENRRSIRKFAEERAKDWVEIKRLYQWWKDNWDKLDFYDEDGTTDKNLLSLINLRNYLWT